MSLKNHKPTKTLLAAALMFLFATLSCQPTSQQQNANAPQSGTPVSLGNVTQWNEFVSEYIESYFAARPDFAVLSGRHEYDGKLPDWSADGLKKEIARLHQMRDRTMSFADNSLNDDERFERDYLLARIDGDLFWMESADWPHRNPYYYADPLDPDVYISRDYAPLPDRLRAYTNYAKAVPTAIEQVRQNLRLPLARSFIKIGRLTLGGLANTYQSDVPKIFAAVKDDGLQNDFRAANETAIKAMRDFDRWLGEQEASATDDFALGPEKFSEMLRATERVDVPLDRLEAIGREDLNRNLNALRDACTQYAQGQTIAQCVAKEQANKPAGGAVDGARAQLADLKKFIADHDLVTIPGTEDAKVDEAPPYKRWNFAYINIPGPYEKNLPSIYYISPPDPAWSQKQRDEYVPGKANLLFTSVHEVWPGHFLQFLHANRAPSKFGQVFVGYAFAEGWAHYTEEMMWDAGLGEGDAETHVGQLLNALLRNVRFLSAIGMHARGMSMAESERMFEQEAFQDAGTAQQQAARGTFDPAYLNYTLGKLMIRKLRDDWTTSRGGRAAWKDFHDQFLKFGGPPIPLARSRMLGRDAGPAL